MIKAIEITKRYTSKEVKQIAGLFLYLNNINIEWEDYKTGVSAKWLWKLLNPLTKTEKKQRFDDWFNSVSNISRLKEWEDFIKIEEIIKKPINKPSIAWAKNSVQAKRGWNKGFIPIKETDYILTLRAGEYCATLTKWDSGDLYRRFIFDIKDEFIRLVFRFWKSIETRNNFTKSISKLDWFKELPQEKQSVLYWWATNIIYLELFWVKASEYKEKNKLTKKEKAKHYFTKEWLFDLEKLENDVAVIIKFQKPKTKEDLENTIKEYIDTIEIE